MAIAYLPTVPIRNIPIFYFFEFVCAVYKFKEIIVIRRKNYTHRVTQGFKNYNIIFSERVQPVKPCLHICNGQLIVKIICTNNYHIWVNQSPSFDFYLHKMLQLQGGAAP